MSRGDSYRTLLNAQFPGRRASGWLHGERIFLTDGERTIRYRDFPSIMRNADRFLSSQLSEIWRVPNCDTPPSFWLGIDTTERLEAALWMIYCWMRFIPFIPFAKSWLEPATLFQPDIVLCTSPGTQAVLKDIGLYATDNTSTVAKSLLAPALSRHLSGKTHYASHGSTGDVHESSRTLYAGLFDQSDHYFCGLATSGSSGRPKRVALLRRNMIAAAENAFKADIKKTAHGNENDGLGDRNYLWGNCLPLYHAGGLAIVFRALLSGTGLYVWNQFDPETVTRDLKDHPDIRRISLVPTMLKRLMEYHTATGTHAPRGLDMVLVGGGPSNPELLEGARHKSWPVCFSYGMTETIGQIAAQDPGNDDPAGSVGRPFPGLEAVIHDGQGSELQRGETGILRIRGPQVFPGYMGTDRQIVFSEFGPDQDGWFETGDYARMDDKGRLYFEARRTDLIISGGQNVNPSEVEEILLESPHVRDAAVTGLDDEEWGQIVVAFIVPDHAQERTVGGVVSAIETFASESLKPHQRPKKIHLVASIPRTSLGKIERGRLRKLATDRPV